MMRGNIVKIEIEDKFITAEFEEANSMGDNIITMGYDENSAVALCVDLLARLVITEEAQSVGISLGPANGEAVNSIG